MQNGMVNDKTRGLGAKIADYALNHDFNDIVATKYVNHENTACYKFEGWKECMENTWDVELLDELVHIPSRVFNKDKYSCWTEEFKEFVAENQFDQLVFVGINTGCCVLHSAFDAYNDLQDCCVIDNLCGSTSGESSHKAAIQILRECITTQRVITV